MTISETDYNTTKQTVEMLHIKIKDFIDKDTETELEISDIPNYGKGLVDMVTYLLDRNKELNALNITNSAALNANSAESKAKSNAQQAKIDSLIKIAQRFQELATTITTADPK